MSQNLWDDLVPGDIIQIGSNGWLALYISKAIVSANSDGSVPAAHCILLMWAGKTSLIVAYGGV